MHREGLVVHNPYDRQTHKLMHISQYVEKGRGFKPMKLHSQLEHAESQHEIVAICKSRRKEAINSMF